MWSLAFIILVLFNVVDSGRTVRNLFNLDPRDTSSEDKRHRGNEQDDSDEGDDYQQMVMASPTPDDKLKYNEDFNKNYCGPLYLSGNYNSVQSLLRKYRYDSKGTLIPASVKYFLKSTDPESGTPHLVELHDKSFSSSGGFIRYYKAVPPVPQYFSPIS